MAVSEYHLDTRIRRRHVPLFTQQRRLRHLRSVCTRNVVIPDRDEYKEFSINFTLHNKLHAPAFYTSEAISDGLNPSWKDFESSNFPDNIDTAASYVIVRIWNDRQLLIEWVVFFTGLTYLGEQIPKEGKNFKPNTILLGMSEGYYGCSDCYQYNTGNTGDIELKGSLDAEMSLIRTSYNLSTLSRIKTVERAIKQTQAAVHKRRNSISDKLQSCQELHTIQALQELLRIKISVLQTEVQYQQRSSVSLEKEITTAMDKLLKKKSEISRKMEEQKKLFEKCCDLSKTYIEFRESLLKSEAQLNFRRKELISELSNIYPIVEFPDRNGYSIHNVHLPNSENFAGHDDTMIAVALGYVCHIVLMISQFLNVPLRYPINFYGSRSTIVDHISSTLPEKTREFPLHLKNKERRWFEYGVFLLNKNIAQLRILCRMSTRDLSATLPNLGSLLELKVSANSDSQTSVLHKESKSSISSDKPLQNGVSDFPRSSPHTTPLKTSHSQLEFLKQEMAAMIPHSSPSNDPRIPTTTTMDTSGAALSSSLDKGLDDIKMMEKSVEMESRDLEVTDVSQKDQSQVTLLRQGYHHSSYPNLNTKLSVADGYPYNLDSTDSPMLSIPPRVWTAESSRTNSEEEPDEGKVHHPVETNNVLNDSIFYIPTAESPEKRQDNPDMTFKREEIRKVAESADFSADLSLRTDQLANRTSSFQMQRLQLLSAEDGDQLPRV